MPSFSPRFLIVVLLVSFLANWYYNSKYFDYPSINYENGKIIASISSDHSRAVFENVTPITLSGRLIAISDVSGEITRSGIMTQLRYIDDQSFEDIKRNYINKKQCASGYLNQNKHDLLLIFPSEKQLNEVKSLAKKEIDLEANQFTLRGRQIRLIDYTYRGEANYATWNNVSAVLVNDLNVESGTGEERFIPRAVRAE